MITHVLAIQCERCGKVEPYHDLNDALEILSRARRHGWEWSDTDHSVCPRCVSQLDSVQNWRPDHHAHVTTKKS